MRKILRYQLDFPLMGYPTVVGIPMDAKVVAAGYQEHRGAFSLWAEVSEDHQPDGGRRVALLATGATVPEGFEHYKTIVMPDDFHVYHIYVEGGWL